MKAILKNTWNVLDKKETKQFNFLILLDIIISIVDILALALLLWIIQFYIQPEKSSLSILPGWLASIDPVAFIAIFFLIFGLKNIAGFLINRAHYRFTGDVAVRISRNNLLQYQRSGFNEFVSVDSSKHLRKIAFQPFEFCQYILSGIQQIITQSFLIILTIVAIILFDAELFLLLLAILLPPVIAIFYFIKNRLNKAKKHIRYSNEKSFQYLLDALKGYVEGNIYHRNDFFLQRFIRTRQQFSTALFESISIQNMPSRIIEIFAVLGLFILIAIAKWTGDNDHSTLITIGAFMAAAYKIIPGIVRIINTSGQIRAYEFSVNDLVQHDQYVGIKAEVKLLEGIESLQLRNIRFEYNQQPVLDNFNLAVVRGDFLGISGESGKGKTTILNLVLGFLEPSNGEVLINGQKVNSERIKDHWPAIAYVRQQSFLIHDTILRNITLEEDGYVTEKLDYALEKSGLTDFISKLPEGLAKIISENGKNISGGQQQRIALARALYKKADLVLLDEPFSELDEASTNILLEHFSELSRSGKTIIMITHDKKSLSFCNKTILL